MNSMSIGRSCNRRGRVRRNHQPLLGGGAWGMGSEDALLAGGPKLGVGKKEKTRSSVAQGAKEPNSFAHGAREPLASWSGNSTYLAHGGAQ
jgi:hypothetical protein